MSLNGTIRYQPSTRARGCEDDHLTIFHLHDPSRTMTPPTCGALGTELPLLRLDGRNPIVTVELSL